MNRTTRNTLMLSLLGGLVLSANAWAQDDSPPKSMDSNGDGMVSATEHATGARMMFDKMDANRDGNITAAEMDAGHAMMMKHDESMSRGHDMPGHDMPGKGMDPGMPHDGMMAMMDGNRDGTITAQEHAAGAKAMFDKMDANRDGKVTSAEMAASHEMMKKHDEGMHRGHAMPGKGMRMGHGIASADMLRKMDGNRDGRVSAAEHAAGVQVMFREADTNKDGNLSKAEMAAHHESMMKPGTGHADRKDGDHDKH